MTLIAETQFPVATCSVCGHFHARRTDGTITSERSCTDCGTCRVARDLDPLADDWDGLIKLTPSGDRIVNRAAGIALERGLPFAEALRISVRVEQDPLGPDGRFGFGICARCGESFRAGDEMAEIAYELDGEYLTGVVHAGCMTEDDGIA